MPVAAAGYAAVEDYDSTAKVGLAAPAVGGDYGWASAGSAGFSASRTSVCTSPVPGTFD